MSLKNDLLSAKTEEDVKDAYIKALGLKAYNKTLVDIRTKEVWFEAKGVSTAPVMMFTQLLFYVRAARKLGEPIPPFLCVIDPHKAAIMETEKAFPLLDSKEMRWPKSGSKVDRALAAKAAPYIEAHFVVYTVADDEANFIGAVKSAIKAGKIIRTAITPDNLRQVFDRWVDLIGSDLNGVKPSDYALLFFADIMHDGKKAAISDLSAKLLHDDDKPVFLLYGHLYALNGLSGYRNFWAIYDRPPEEEYRQYLLERRDTLLPLDERAFKGAYFTPLRVVDKAYDELASVLGKRWQQRYIVWDMCCGVGNLEVKHTNYRNVFMSTLDQADVDVMAASHTCAGASKFQYDYLNDDISEFGTIDYSLSQKVPEELRDAIVASNQNIKGAKKILVLINPPYAEATSSDNVASQGVDKSKTGVARSKLATSAMKPYGKATNELLTQFLARVQLEIPGATVAVFGKLKYINSQAFESFRSVWKARYLGGFVVPSRVFDGLTGEFPIGFLIWDLSKKEPIKEVVADVLDRSIHLIGDKTFLNIENDKLLATWPMRPAVNDVPALPLKGAVEPATATRDLRGTKSSDGALGWFNCAGNDLQQAPGLTMLLSSGFGSGRGFFVNESNLWQVATMFAVRLLVRKTWLNDRDQFLQATKPLSEVFILDCLVWMLFHRSNLSAGAENILWNGTRWKLVNHFIPFIEQDVGVSGRFESNFMTTYLKGKKLSAEARNLLAQGRVIWAKYHSTKFNRSIHDSLRLGRPDVGWFQIRRALEANEVNVVTDFSPFYAAQASLSQKLLPDVYEYGFLPS